MSRAGPLLLLAALVAAPAEAQVDAPTWEDPTLASAVADADLIVLAQATAVGRQGAAYRVARTLKGPRRDGAVLAITGLHHPQLRERPSVKPGDEAYLLLRGKPRGEGFSLPTPTFGRFPLQELAGGKRIVVASLGGVETFVRLAVTPGRFEAILRGLVAGKAPRLVSSARSLLQRQDPQSDDLYLALGILGLFARADDHARLLPRVLELLEDERYRTGRMFRIRTSAARVLARLGGSAAVRRLVELLCCDRVRAVQSVAAAGIGRALADDRSSPLLGVIARRIARLAPKLSCRPVTFAPSKDPRTNRLESPLAACLRSLGQLGARDGLAPALRALERDDAEAIEAGLAYFSALGDVEQAGAVAQRMRPRDSRDALVNPLFGRVLEALTGEKLGADREAWLRWWRGRAARRGDGSER